MIRGLYTAYTGMSTEQKRLDIISNNIANSATVGYKEESVTSQSFDKVLGIKIKDGSEMYLDRPIGKMSLGVKIGEVYTDYGQGSLRSTGNTYDIAIEGDGFFGLAVTNRAGETSIKYTRNGNFKCTRDGYIVDDDGNRLQGSSGDVQVPTDAAEIAIGLDGQIFADGVPIGQISLYDFADYDYLDKYGDSMYQTVDGATMIAATGAMHQGYTEQSNVNVVSEMVDLITITRAYEAGQKVIQTEDELLSKSVNEVGKLG